MRRVREALAGAALCAAIAAPAGAQALFDLQKVADGVYAALATPRSPINCNAASSSTTTAALQLIGDLGVARAA